MSKKGWLTVAFFYLTDSVGGLPATIYICKAQSVNVSFWISLVALLWIVATIIILMALLIWGCNEFIGYIVYENSKLKQPVVIASIIIFVIAMACTGGYVTIRYLI